MCRSAFQRHLPIREGRLFAAAKPICSSLASRNPRTTIWKMIIKPLICLKNSHSKDSNEPGNKRSDNNSDNNTHTSSTDSGQDLASDDAGDNTVTNHDYDIEERDQLCRPVAHEIASHNLHCRLVCQTISSIWTTLIQSPELWTMRKIREKWDIAYHCAVATLRTPNTHVGSPY